MFYFQNRMNSPKWPCIFPRRNFYSIPHFGIFGGILKSLVVLLFLLCDSNISSVHALKPKITFDRLTIEDGLSQSTVRAILQDRKGFMWFGTSDGLNRYDGYNFKIFKTDPEDSSTISHNHILAIYEDSEGILWIGTWNGLNKYDHDNETFTRHSHDINNPRSISHYFVTCILEDYAGNLWIGTEGGLDVFDRNTETCTQYLYNPSDPGKSRIKNITFLYEDSQKHLWVCTEEDGLIRFDYKSGEIKQYKNDPGDPESISSNNVDSICEDLTGNFWVATDDRGINYFDPTTEKFIRFRHDPDNPESISSDKFGSIYIDSQSNLWAGTDGGGLNLYDKNTGRFYHYKSDIYDPTSLSNNTILSIYEDKAGILWIGTFNNGLNKLDLMAKSFGHYSFHFPVVNRYEVNNIVSAICEDDSGNIWLGTDGGGLILFDRIHDVFNRFTVKSGKQSFPNDDVILSIYEDRLGVLWLGTYTGGLNAYDPKTDQITQYRHDSKNPNCIGSDFIRTISEDENGNLWLGTIEGGLNVYNRKTGKFTRYLNNPEDQSSISENIVSSFLIDSKGSIWVGTWSGGLNKFDKKTEKFIRYMYDPDNPNSLSQDNVSSIYEDSSGTLWIGTGGGLNKFNPQDGTFYKYTEKNGLPNNVINGILEDNDHNLWLSTSKGLSKFDPADDSFRNYTSQDGLQGDEYNIGAYFKCKDGNLIFGGKNGFNIFNPVSIRDNNYVSPIVFTDLQIFNKSVSIGLNNEGRIILHKSITYTSDLLLSYRDYVFSFEFVSLHYSNPQNNQYAYIMDGFENEWNYVGNRNFATYTNLPPGKYIFRVKGTNSDGIWNEKGTSIHIKVTPPFWKTVWFRATGICVLLLLTFILHRLITENIKKRNRELEEHNIQLNKLISDRKNAEIALLESEEKYRSVIENANVIILVVQDGVMKFINTVTNKITGYLNEELIGKPFVDLIHYDDRKMVIERHKKRLKGEDIIDLYTFRIVSKSGQIKWLEIKAVKILWEKRPATLNFITDITEQKQLESQFIQAQKMEIVGRLAGGVAHDFNNMLTVINGNAELALMALKPDNPLYKDIREIKITADRAANLTRQLLAFSRKQIIEPKILNLNTTLVEMDKMLRRLIGEDIELQTLPADNLWLVKADSGQIEQVLTNLIVNARDAISGTGKITIEMSNVALDNEYARQHSEVKPGEYIMIAVSDTGSGMDEEIKAHIFEPFFTTKEKDKGTGLGLATCYGIVKQNEGHICVESEPKHGTTIKIFLPKAEGQNAEMQKRPELSDTPHGSGTILFVEDENTVRSLVARILKNKGYTILEAPNGEEALIIAEDIKSGSIDLLITDVVMPKMGGKELSVQIGKIHPDIKILFISGYTDNSIIRQGILNRGISFLQKPFTPAGLLQKVNEILGES